MPKTQVSGYALIMWFQRTQQAGSQFLYTLKAARSVDAIILQVARKFCMANRSHLRIAFADHLSNFGPQCHDVPCSLFINAKVITPLATPTQTSKHDKRSNSLERQENATRRGLPHCGRLQLAHDLLIRIAAIPRPRNRGIP